MDLPTVDQIKDLTGKRVLVRGDIDVPLTQQSTNNGQLTTITDDTRLKDIFLTIDFLLKQSCQVILAGHLGRPEGKAVQELSSKPIQEYFPQIKVLENLRFDPREEANDEGYAKELASLADIYINEAFAASERAHASIVGVPKFLPHYAGFRLTKEVEILLGVLENPARPLLVIIGGAKIETKQPLIDKMKGFADAVVIGGKLATEEKDFLIESLPEAKTIVWNGPMGDIENGHGTGTKKLVDLILAQKDAYKIVGGGDTVGFINKLGLLDKFDWVSSGGGSMLKLLAGEKLPGIEALRL